MAAPLPPLQIPANRCLRFEFLCWLDTALLDAVILRTLSRGSLQGCGPSHAAQSGPEVAVRELWTDGLRRRLQGSDPQPPPVCTPAETIHPGATRHLPVSQQGGVAWQGRTAAALPLQQAGGCLVLSACYWALAWAHA